MTFQTLTSLMPHQHAPVAKLLPQRVGALFMDMGTGKSRTLIELARLRASKWDRLFWFCPVSGKDSIHYQWQIHTDLPPDAIHVWNDRTSADNLPVTARVHIIGIESMSASDRVVAAYFNLITDKSFVVVDESQYIKGHRSKRTMRITHMSEHCRYRALLTGTPFSQGAVDLFSQMKFLSPKILGYSSFWSFAANHLEYEVKKDAFGRKRQTGRIIRAHNEKYLAAKISPYVYQVRKDECLDLPEKLYETRVCRMSSEQRALYERAKREILLELDYDDWSAVRIFHLFSTLQSIVCGFWNRNQGETSELIEVEHNRLDLLLGVVAEIPATEKVIIWAKYHYVVHQITEALATNYGADSVCQYYGPLSEKKRAAQLAKWRSESRFLVATQDTGGQVHTFNEAAYSIFYADSFKYDKRRQAEDRNHRIGQTRRPVYITLHCVSSIDDRIVAAIARKGDALAEFQKMIDCYKANGIKQMAIDMLKGL